MLQLLIVLLLIVLLLIELLLVVHLDERRQLGGVLRLRSAVRAIVVGRLFVRAFADRLFAVRLRLLEVLLFRSARRRVFRRTQGAQSCLGLEFRSPGRVFCCVALCRGGGRGRGGSGRGGGGSGIGRDGGGIGRVGGGAAGQNGRRDVGRGGSCDRSGRSGGVIL